MKPKPKLFEALDKLNAPEPDDFYAHCQVGHTTHETKLLRRSLSGIAEFDIEVYDWEQYFTTVAGNETTPMYAEYCTGQDIISYCIDRQGVWESTETAVINAILQEPNKDKIMLDFGSHIGWYTNIGLMQGYTVASFDASKENLELLRRTAVLNGTLEGSYPYLCWLDNEAPILSAGAEEVQLVKVDVEGAEHHALRMISELINAKKVKYAIFEISPVFNGNYPKLVNDIVESGYRVYQLPNTLTTDDALAEVRRDCELTQRDEELKAYIDGLHQENMLFIRRDDV
jgi:hypothetical protein